MKNIKFALTKNKLNAPLKFINSGCSLLNLAGSQKADGGFPRGRIINFVGDGSSGKTLLALEVCAHAFYEIKDVKKKYVVYNNVEGVMDFDISGMYGKEFAESIIWESSDTCEKLGRSVMSWLQKIKPGDFLLYVADSLDATVSEKAKARTMKAVKQNKEEEGSYGTEKAKYFSATFFSNVCSLMKGKDATLICISQIREKIGITFGEKYYRAGGKALDFYTHQVLWLAEIEKISKQYKGHKRIIAVRIKGRFKRNKVALAFRECEFQILWNYGIDNIATCLDFIYGKDKDSIPWNNGREEILYKREELIKRLEEKPKALQRLINLISEFWNKIESKVKAQRKRKF